MSLVPHGGVTLPLPTPELIWKLDHMQTLYDVARLGWLAGLEGNPWRIAIGRFGRATAFVSGAVPSPQYNKVAGLGVAELPLLDDVAGFLGTHRAPTVRVDLLPGQLDSILADRLATFGLCHVGSLAVYYGAPLAARHVPPDGVSIRPVESDEEVTAFLEIFHAGLELPAATRGSFIQDMRFWRDLPGCHLYLAWIDGTPCSVGLLYRRDGLGHLATSTTLPAFRRRGCQRALIQHAIDHAAKLGCELVCSQSEIYSSTARNLERQGMRLACHKAVWMQRRRPSTGSLYSSSEGSLY